MKLEKILMELEAPKLVKKVNLSKDESNKSFKCENVKDYKEAIINLVGEKDSVKLAIILDIEKEYAYMVNRSSFHESLANTWNIPNDITNERFISFTATYIKSKGLNVETLGMSGVHKKSYDNLTGWLKRVFIF
jgi:hypothetical protein